MRVKPDPEAQPVYALNLFDVADRDEYLAYSRRSARKVGRRGGRVRRRQLRLHLFDKLEDLRPLLR